MRAELLGVGIYSIPEAARYARVHPGRIRRWLQGYSYVYKGEDRRTPPLWTHEIPSVDGSLALSFRDLIELLFVDAFRRFGVQWKEIKGAASIAADLIHDSHPFSTRSFKTDGRKIIEEAGERMGSKKLLEIVEGQYAIEEVVGPHLYPGLEFSAGEQGVARWLPLCESSLVVLDPAIQFGRPVVRPYGIRTEILSRAVTANSSVKEVSEWFEIPVDAVADAVLYEQRLAA